MTLDTIHLRMVGLSRLAAAIGGLGILFIAVMVTVDVLLRKLFDVTLGGASEVSGMVFAVATAMSYSYVLLERANVRIDVIYTNVSSKVRALLDLVALIAFLGFVGPLTRSIYLVMEKSWAGGTRTVGVLHMPLWLPQLLWLAGFVLLTLTAIFLLLCTLSRLRRRDWTGVNLIAGVPSIGETIEDETHVEPVAETPRAGPAGTGGRA